MVETLSTETVLYGTSTVLKPALCLDLDGTVRYSKSGGFIKSPEDIALYHGVEEKIWDYRDRGYLILGVSNQGGVAHGFKTPARVTAEITATLALFRRRGAGMEPFHMIRHCYHDPTGRIFPFCYRSLLCKPAIGMLAVMEWEMAEQGIAIDWDRSLFVGDRAEDEGCALAAGITFFSAAAFFGQDKGEEEAVARKVFSNGGDWLVADSPEEALSFCAQRYEIHAADLEVSDFVALPDDKTVTVTDHSNDSKRTKTCAEWAASAPKGMLCSINY